MPMDLEAMAKKITEAQSGNLYGTQISDLQSQLEHSIQSGMSPEQKAAAYSQNDERRSAIRKLRDANVQAFDETKNIKGLTYRPGGGGGGAETWGSPVMKGAGDGLGSIAALLGALKGNLAYNSRNLGVGSHNNFNAYARDEASGQIDALQPLYDELLQSQKTNNQKDYLDMFNEQKAHMAAQINGNRSAAPPLMSTMMRQPQPMARPQLPQPQQDPLKDARQAAMDLIMHYVNMRPTTPR